MTTEVEKIKAEIAATRATLINEGRALIEVGEEPFSLDIPRKDLTNLAIQVCAAKEKNDVYMAFLLHTHLTQDLHLENGFLKFTDYISSVLKFTDGPKAMSMIKAWDAFLAVGLPLKVLGGPKAIAWSKFRALVPAINTGDINEDNITEWLPYIATVGTHALSATDIKNKVKLLIHREQRQKDPESETVVSLRMNAADRANFTERVRVLSDVTHTDATSEVVLNALDYQVAQMANQSDTAASMLGVTGLKQIIERMVPGTEMVLLGAEGSTPSVDVPVVKAYVSRDPNHPDDETRFVVALATDSAIIKQLYGDSFLPADILNVSDGLTHSFVSAETLKAVPEKSTKQVNPSATKSPQGKSLREEITESEAARLDDIPDMTVHNLVAMDYDYFDFSEQGLKCIEDEDVQMITAALKKKLINDNKLTEDMLASLCEEAIANVDMTDDDDGSLETMRLVLLKSLILSI